MTIADWLTAGGAVTNPLFQTEGLHPVTFTRGAMLKLKRHPDFDAGLIGVVEAGLKDPSWQGFVYLMHFGQGAALDPLYVGKTEKKGTSRPLSFNIENIRTNQHAFGRWGYGLAYHIGDLSHVLFREAGYKKPAPKYERWADCLFETRNPLQLRQPVFVTLVSWRDGMRGPSGLIGSAPAVEKELIALCGGTEGGRLLNVDGR